MKKLGYLLSVAKDGRFWVRGHSRYLLDNLIHRGKNAATGYSDDDHLNAAAHWLESAQDATLDGGVVGRYRLKVGWTSSYPETTGYIIPTFLALAKDLNQERYIERARRAVTFLLGIQLENGAFPGLEIAENRHVPSPFNTGQIINGLVAWAVATDDKMALAAARRAGDWLISIQDEDGAWRKHYYNGVVSTYAAHIACWLAQLGQCGGDGKYLCAASRNVDWVLSHRVPETGWIENMGFDQSHHKARIAHTHTIAYTLWGILRTCELLNRQDGIDAVSHAAERIARRVELSRWLPGMLDWRWKGAANYACLTGNAQMALIWFKLHEITKNTLFVNAALKAIDLVKRAQPMENQNPGIRGGIAGSDPVWCGYISMCVPNWAAKYFVDALLEKKRILPILAQRKQGCWQLPVDVPLFSASPRSELQLSRPPRVVMLTRDTSIKLPQMLKAWAVWGFKPDLVLVERGHVFSFNERLWAAIEEHGVSHVLGRALGIKRKHASTTANAISTLTQDLPSPVAYCQARGIVFAVVDDINGAAALQRLKEATPLIAIHAGAGIVRSQLLALLPMGVINAHMGILPHYRGMNASEWAMFNGDPVGCTVHMIDAGIDTGGIICARLVDTTGITDVATLRKKVDDAQIAMLGEVLQITMTTGALPPVRPQKQEEGIQYFRMHPDLARLLFASAKGKGHCN